MIMGHGNLQKWKKHISDILVTAQSLILATEASALLSSPQLDIFQTTYIIDKLKVLIQFYY
jgi:hypothetical protein